MGVVYSAYDEELDRRVALKLLRPGRDNSERNQNRMQREAQAMAKLSHPNVVQVYEVGRFEEQVFLAMEFVQGKTLAAWLKAEGPKKTGPSGIGKANYTWYLRNVLLVPLSWEDEVTITRRGTDTVEEVRVGGRISYLKVTPRIGRPYYLVPSNSGTQFLRYDSLDFGLRPPMWQLFSW